MNKSELDFRKPPRETNPTSKNETPTIKEIS